MSAASACRFDTVAQNVPQTVADEGDAAAVGRLMDIGKRYADRHNDSAVFYFEAALQVAQKRNDTEGVYAAGSVYARFSVYEKASNIKPRRHRHTSQFYAQYLAHCAQRTAYFYLKRLPLWHFSAKL